MDTTSPSNAQPPAGDGNRHGWAAGISLGIIGFAMVVLFVLPGFVAAEISKHSNTFFSFDGDVKWDFDDFIRPQDPGLFRGELLILAPSAWLMNHSQTIHRFYSWQYRTAKGVNLDRRLEL